MQNALAVSNKVEVREDELSVYHGGKHVPPAPRLEFGDWVSWVNRKDERTQGMFVQFDEDKLARVRVNMHLYIRVAPNRLTVH